jgi:hypothetical protein
MVRLLGLHKAFFLTNLVDKCAYFYEKEMLSDDGCFFMTHANQCGDTGFSEYQIREMKKELITLGLIRTQMRGVPAKEFYQIDFVKIQELLYGGDKSVLENLEYKTYQKLEDYTYQKVEEYKDTKSKDTKSNNHHQQNKKNGELFHVEQPDNPLKVEKVVELYHKYCPSYPKVVRITSTRKKHINARLKEHSLATFKSVFQKAEASDFLSGRNGKWNTSKPCNLDWMLNEHNMVKILEGNYDKNDTSQPTPSQTPEEIYHKWGINHASALTNLLKRIHPRIIALLKEGANNIPDESTLADQIGKFLHTIEEAQRKATIRDPARRDRIPSPIGLLDRYLDWFDGEGRWVKNIRLANFSYTDTIFKKFLLAEGRLQETDQITGDSTL